MIRQGRQYATSLRDIRDDHLCRYEAACDSIKARCIDSVVDAGCGIGYGSHLMAKTGASVYGFDHSEDAVEFGREHFHANLHVGKLLTLEPPEADMLTMFEIIEHTDDAPEFLRWASDRFEYLMCSVPNEEVVPFDSPNTHSDHVRHYTPDEFEALLIDSGWQILRKGSQRDKTGPGARIDWGSTAGRTLVFEGIA
jgi:2-polyprenyl-3-methyl-5-hydroxy-6-metoxy-1,4-benzoquinol methylase